jgi:hypothetical protein
LNELIGFFIGENFGEVVSAGAITVSVNNGVESLIDTGCGIFKLLVDVSFCTGACVVTVSCAIAASVEKRRMSRMR